VFDPNTSTQNLGNLDRVDYTGAELEVRGRILEGFDGYVGLGYTDSDIKESRRAASDIGNQAPLVSKYTANVRARTARRAPAARPRPGCV
jgi:iron complex outermembrane recepter protein